MREKEESEKVDLKLNIKKKTNIMAAVTDFIMGAWKSLWMVTSATKLNDAYSLEEKLWET